MGQILSKSLTHFLLTYSTEPLLTLLGQLDAGVCRNVQREAFIGSDGSLYINVIYTNIERFCDIGNHHEVSYSC